MDTTFLTYLLTFSLVILLVLYLYQITDGSLINNYKQNQNKKNKKKIIEPIIEYTKQKKECMPIHHVGPVYNFHQYFNKYKHIPNAGMPTGIPEMGWRNFFLANYSKSQVVEEDPFEGIPTRNFLDNLENVKNLYREC